MDELTDHISMYEAIYSRTAVKNGINNTPDMFQLQNMDNLAVNIFEPLRIGLNDVPIFISSFFRCSELNKLMRGAKNSQHMAMNGAAMDLDNDGFPQYQPNYMLFFYIFKYLNFDQLIWEFGQNPYNFASSLGKAPGTYPKPAWVHVSYVSHEKNRHEVLVSKKVFNSEKNELETEYSKFNVSRLNYQVVV